MIEFVTLLEEDRKIAVPEDQLVKFETVADVAAFLNEYAAQPGRAPASAQKDRLALSDKEKADLAVSDNRSPLFRVCPPFCSAASRILWGLKVRGRENLVKDRPVIFVSNHASFLDPIWLACALPWPVRKKTFTVGKQELLHYPVLPFFLKRFNLIAVEREGDVQSALKASLAVLNQGRNLVIFPEGTRTRTGEMNRFRSGIGFLMAEAGADIVPVKVQGSYAIWPAGRGPRIFGSGNGRPTLTFGPPVSLAALCEAKNITPGDHDAVAEAVQDVVAGL
jgi:1-acyl-sn-glycerol-3-phosphate acyltransferase